jgi:enamine deaminase RidA (YjgF/YER057c/UK114 family)
MSAEAKLKELGIELREVPTGDRPLVPSVLTGNLLFLSGNGPTWGGKTWRCVALNLLSATRSALGSLDKVKRVVKVLGMVNSAPGFSQQPQVINGCSDLLVQVFGQNGRHARSAVGMAGLPGNIPVEIEMILEVEA